MISKLAQVSEMAQIGEDVIVEPFSYIAGDVVIGSGCHIGPGAVILDGARVKPGFHAWEIITQKQEIHRDHRAIATLDIMKHLPEGWHIRSLPEQGSDRKFLRVALPDRTTRILMLSDDRDKDFGRFIELGTFFNLFASRSGKSYGIGTY